MIRGIPFPQYSSGPIDTALPLVFMLIKDDATINLFPAVFAVFPTIVEKSCRPRRLVSRVALVALLPAPPMPTQYPLVFPGNAGLGHMV